MTNFDLTDNQLVQLVKTAEQLPVDQQKILIQVLSDKMNNNKKSKQGAYQDLYQKLMDTFKKASKQKGKIKGAVPKTVNENDERLK